MFKQKSKFRAALWLIVFAALAVCIAIRPERFSNAFSYVWGVFDRIIAGFFVAFILNLILVPVEKLLTRLFGRHAGKKGISGLKRSLGIVITLALALALVSLVAISIEHCAKGVAEMLANAFSGTLSDLPDVPRGIVEKMGITPEKLQKLYGFLSSLGDQLLGILEDGVRLPLTFVYNLTTGILSGVIDVILVLAVSIYVLATKEKLGAAAHRLVDAYLKPRPHRIVNDLQDLMFDKFSDFFRGQLLEALILGVLCFLGMLIFRFPNAGDVSILVGICAIVPVAGPWVGSIVSILIELIADPVKGLLFAVFILVLQQVEDNVIYPRIVGNSMGVPGLLVLCAVIVGGEIYGMLGIILAVPLSAVLYELISRDVKNRLQKAEEESHADAD